MELQEEFENAAERAKKLPRQPDETLLKLYSLYKQGTIGDINVDRPTNPFDMVGLAKHGSWEELKGMSKEEAKRQYIKLVSELEAKK